MPGPEGAPDGGASMMMMMMVGWLVVATALFLLRPPSLRNRGDQKPSPPGVSLSHFNVTIFSPPVQLQSGLVCIAFCLSARMANNSWKIYLIGTRNFPQSSRSLGEHKCE